MAATSDTPKRGPGRPADGFPRRREEIIEVAKGLFAANGYPNTTVAQICETAGLTKGLFYHYVKSKEELLLAIFDSYTIPTLQALREVRDSPESCTDQLREISSLMVRTIAANLAEVNIVDRELPLLRSDDPQWAPSRKRMREIDAIIRNVIRGGVESGEFLPMDEVLGAMAFWGMHNHISRWFGPKWTDRVDDIADAFAQVLLRGFVAAPQRKRR
ncbi:MAG TPA: TetR/AcrR family transcriptional regulator [Amycolatopsis sp.]|nr:TetR/AcrR family transcriptional regulator [Amycolatopsis sp.]